MKKKVRKEIDAVLLTAFITLLLSFAVYLDGRQNPTLGTYSPLPIETIQYSPEPSTPVLNDTPVIVYLNNTKFIPSMMMIKQGDTVTWQNVDPRRVYRLYEKAVDSRVNEFLSLRESFSYQFNKTGTFYFADATFQYMQMKVIVE